MITKEHIDLLNEYGCLSTSLLTRKYKYSNEMCREILKEILNAYMNVKAAGKDKIWIDGREPKKKKWKDVRKPRG